MADKLGNDCAIELGRAVDRARDRPPLRAHRVGRADIFRPLL